MVPAGTHLANVVVLYNSRGESLEPVREASAGPGQNLWGPRAIGPAAPSTLSPEGAVNLREYRCPPHYLPLIFL